MNTTTYSLSNNGSTNYIVDNGNTRDTEIIIYVREGDTIKFEATSSVTSAHPFLMSTEANDMDSSNDIGAMEGWNKDTLTLTVNSNTPDTIYPHCQFHNGMYANSKIVKVSQFDQNLIDVGCGTGDIGKLFSDATDSKCRILSIDPNAQMIELGKKKLRNYLCFKR